MPCRTAPQVINDLTKVFIKDLKAGNIAHGLGKTHANIVSEARNSATIMVERRLAAIKEEMEAEVDKEAELTGAALELNANKPRVRSAKSKSLVSVTVVEVNNDKVYVKFPRGEKIYKYNPEEVSLDQGDARTIVNKYTSLKAPTKSVTDKTPAKGKSTPVKVKEAPKASNEVKKGTKLLHVSTETFDAFATAGEDIGDGFTVGVGVHVGTKDTTGELATQRGSDTIVYDVTINDDIKVLEMKDTGDSKWTANNMHDQLVGIFGEVPLTKKSTDAEVRDFLISKGYSAVKYVNTEEGGVSYMVLDTGKFDIKIKEDIELGSTKEASKVKWKDANRIEDEVHGNIEAMQNLMGELHELGGGKASDKHLEYLKGLLGKMSPDFFENMKTHIFTDAKKSEGMALSKDIKVAVRNKPNIANNQMSDAEVYAHEVVHSMIMFAIRQDTNESRKIKRQLEHMVDAALSKTKWEDFLPAESLDAKVEEQEAKEMYDYIFNSENSIEELIAHTLTNPIVMEHMKSVDIKEEEKAKTLWDKVMNAFISVMEMISGEYSFKDKSKNVYEQALNLSFKLAESNNKAVRERNSKINLAMRLWQGFQKYNIKSGEMLENTWDKYVDKGDYVKPPKEGFARAKWMVGAIAKMITNQHYRKSMELILSGFGFQPEGDIQSILRDFFKSDDLTESVDMLALLSDKVDTAKNILITAVGDLVHKGFNRKLTNDEESALTRVLIDTDMSSISDQFTSKTLSKLLSDDTEVDRRISRVKHKLKELDDVNYNWNTTQGSSLGYFMATGKGHIAQSINARNIAAGVHATHRRKPNAKVVKALDELATLTALKYVNEKARALVKRLMRDNRNGVENVMKIHQEFKKESAKTVFANSEVNMIKGYSKETFDDKVSVVIAPISETKELANDGYELKTELPKNKLDDKSVPMGMFVAESYEIGEWYRSATRLTGVRSRGTTLKEIAISNKHNDKFAISRAGALKEKVEMNRRNLVKKIEKGELDFKDLDHGLIPVLDEDGYVTDYRYVMTNENKNDILKKDSRISTVMSHSFGHTLDKYETKGQNERVLEMLLGDMEENYIEGSTIGKNQKKYILISRDSSNPEIEELYKVLPPMFKRAMQEEASKGLAVRADLLHSYFGYRHASLAGNELIKSVTPRIMHKLLKVAEHMWMEFIKISKVDILIKMPIVMVGNLISNFMYSVMTGTNPVTLIKEYIESSRAVTDYFRRHKELVELRLAKKTGNVEKRDLNRIKTLERQLAESSIAELAELGIYQSIVEDMEHQDIESTNKVKQQLVNELSKAPKIVQQGLEILYLTENTKYHKIMNGLLTKSDLVARDIENRKLKRIQKLQAAGKMDLPKWYVVESSGKDKLKSYKYKAEKRRLTGDERKAFMVKADKQRHSTVLNTFINYNKPSGKIEEYLNRMGFIMFTKYAKRIQRVIAETGAKNPLNVMAILLGEEFIIGDVETIYDQQLLTKSWYSLGLGAGDMIPGTNPFDRIMEVIEPPLVQLIRDPL